MGDYTSSREESDISPEVKEALYKEMNEINGRAEEAEEKKKHADALFKDMTDVRATIEAPGNFVELPCRYSAVCRELYYCFCLI